MRRLIAALAMTVVTVPVFAGDVGVSISIGQPGFYGQIDIGGAPRPVLVQPKPIMIQRAPVGVVERPVYLVVPYKHRRHWSKHCYEYHACGRPVYFVDERWYNDRYVPYYRDRHGRDRRDERDHGRRDDRDYDRRPPHYSDDGREDKRDRRH